MPTLIQSLHNQDLGHLRILRKHVLLLVVCAVVLDGMLISGLAAAAISVPMLLLLPDLLGQIARPFLVARRRRARRSTGDEAVVALPPQHLLRSRSGLNMSARTLAVRLAEESLISLVQSGKEAASQTLKPMPRVGLSVLRLNVLMALPNVARPKARFAEVYYVR